MEKLIREAFCVMGREGSTQEGEGFIQRLWGEANAHFPEIAPFVVMRNGAPAGLWGAMTDFSRSFQPWTENFSQGLYLAGAECLPDAEPPAGWSRWRIPSAEYRILPMEEGALERGLNELRAQGLSLAGAIQEWTDPAQNRTCLCFPVRRL